MADMRMILDVCLLRRFAESRTKTPKKRSRDPIWDNFTEVYDLGELKIVTKHKTSLTSHCEHRHKDDQQPAKKIRASLATEVLSRMRSSIFPIDVKTVSMNYFRHKKIQSALAAALSIPAMSIKSSSSSDVSTVPFYVTKCSDSFKFRDFEISSAEPISDRAEQSEKSSRKS
uniref:Uncharacterized protein n=1 Tax=Ditylenchus dipsaci TaxID=166011 RepID=A0A915DPE5_9BILA